MHDVETIASLPLPWYQLSHKRVLITGAGGISSFLAHVLMYRILQYGDDIHVMIMTRNVEKAMKKFAAYEHRSEFALIQHDVTEPITEKISASIIFHCASNTHPLEYAEDPIGTITTNVMGTYYLLEMDNPFLERFIFLSSVEIYGEARTEKKFSEKDFGYIDCNTLRAGYPESKRLSEALCQAYIHKKGYNIAIARPCRLYGYNEPDDSKATSQFIRSAKNREDIVLKSKGDQLYSFLYLPDCVSALLYILFFAKSGEAYNIADEKSDITLYEFANIAARLAGTKVIYGTPSITEKQGFSVVKNALLDANKLKYLGWAPSFSIEEGIKNAILLANNYYEF